MSMGSAICAEIHNEIINTWKKRFEECKTFEEFQVALREFKDLEFSE